MKKRIAFVLLASLILLSACNAGSNSLANVETPDGDLAGFWLGLWHGFIVLFTFIVSLFNNNVGIYEAHNTGGWYNFGFLMAVMMFWSGSQGGTKKAYSKKKIEVTVTDEVDPDEEIDEEPDE